MSSESRKNRALAAKEKQKKQKTNRIIFITCAVVLLIAVGVTIAVTRENKISEDKYPVATLEIEGYGNVEITLYPNDAPNTVRNFIALANSGFYDGQIIPRVAVGFCVQMGSPDGTLSGNPGYSIKGEFQNNGFDKNTLRHTIGTVSMARGQDKNSAGSQFFICTSSSTSSLNGDYAAFGMVTSGLDEIIAISKVANDNSIEAGGGKPLTDIVIKSIRVDTKGIKYRAPSKIR